MFGTFDGSNVGTTACHYFHFRGSMRFLMQSVFNMGGPTHTCIYIYILKGVRCYLIIYFRLVMQLYAVDDVLNHSP